MSKFKEKSIVQKILIIIAGLVLLFIIAFGISCIPRKVELSMTGNMENFEMDNHYQAIESTKKSYEDTVTFKGKVFTPLFFQHIYYGDIEFEKTPELNISCDFIFTTKSKGLEMYQLDKEKDKTYMWFLVGKTGWKTTRFIKNKFGTYDTEYYDMGVNLKDKKIYFHMDNYKHDAEDDPYQNTNRYIFQTQNY